MNEEFEREARKVMSRCRTGTTNYDAANSLHAECYGTIGRLLIERKELEDRVRKECMGEYGDDTLVKLVLGE